MFRLASVSLVFLLFLISSVFPDSPNPPFIPNYYWIGSGYDQAYASLTLLNKGVRQSIIELGSPKLTPDGLWSIPDNTESQPPTQLCNCGANSTTIQAAYQYQSQVGTSVKTSVSFSDVWSSSLSVDTEQTYSELLTMNYYLYDCWAVCGYYDISFIKYTPLNVTVPFQNAVRTLPTSFDPNSSSSSEILALNQFYTTFGSNVIFSATMGGWIYQRMQTLATTNANMVNNSVNVEEQAEASFEVSIGTDVSYHSSTSVQQEFNSSTTFESITFYGGNNGGATTCGQWSQSVDTAPAPISLGLVSIVEFISPTYFPDDADVEQRAKAYVEYVNYYWSKNAQLYSLFPGFSQAVNSGPQFQVQTTAKCPAGSVILGGGCSTDFSSSNTHPWRLTISAPVSPSNKATEWTCLMGEDFGSGFYFSDARAYTVCSPSFIGNKEANVTVHTQVVTATSGTSSQFDNSATASCPGGYVVTGGGCTVSGTGNDHPWELHDSFPSSSSSWYCYAGEDFGTGLYYQSVTAYAVCTSWESNLKYVPSLPKGYQIVKTSSTDGYQYQNDCFVPCPDQYLLTGGGCQVTDDTDHTWRITDSYPKNNGWNCVAGEDFSSGVYYQSVTCYAICVQL